MSSPAGSAYSQTDFLARWMPSSTRAGVILSPCPDLARSLLHTIPEGAEKPPPDECDSFASDFAPLPASTDSSCIDLDGLPVSPGGERAGSDRLLNGLYSAPPKHSDGEFDSLDEMESNSQEFPLMMKLEQLKMWQQHMQEQLKAHQLEELLRLQEEQQRLLGMMNRSQQCTKDQPENSGVSEEELGGDTVSRASNLRESSYSAPSERPLTRGGRPEWTQSGENREDAHNEEDADMRNSREGDQSQGPYLQKHDDTLIPKNGVALTDDSSRKEDPTLQDRPIKPGIGGRKQTFEELLEEQLRLEEQRLKSARRQQSPGGGEAAQAPPKRAFLKRGEGLSRFSSNHKASFPRKEAKKDPKVPLKSGIISRSNSEPIALLKGATNQRLPVQRKTAILNKENRMRGSSSPPQETKAARMKVLGSHQRQNTDGTESAQTDRGGCHSKVTVQSNRKAGLVVRPDPNTQPNPVTKQVGMLGDRGKADKEAVGERGSGPRMGGSEGVGEGEGGVPQDSFELSFQEKLQRWECDRQMESMALGEFELLEQAAEELSFSSNSSFVMKVLQMDQQQLRLQGVGGLHHRRLSSTPIKSPPRGEVKRCSDVGGESCSVDSQAFIATVRDDAPKDVSVEHQEEDEHPPSSCGGFEEQRVLVEPPLFPSTLCFPAPPDPPYDKRTYQDEDSCRDSVSVVTCGDDGESDGVLNDTDDSTLIEEEGRQGGVVFDDDDTWNDLEDATVSTETENRISPPKPTVLRKVAASRVVEVDEAAVRSSASQEPGPPPPPPPSQLMTRLFPALKPKTQSAPLPSAVPSATPEPTKAEEETGRHIHSRQLRERLVELEIEIERFKKENAALTRLRQENEKNQDSLRKERLEFEQLRAEELAKFEEYKKEEIRKLQKERKLFEKHMVASRAIPDRKEREEIQALKQQLSSLQEELQRKESRWSSTHGRLRQQIDSLTQDNQALRDEVHVLEKLRLGALKRNSMDAEKDKETKQGPSVTKGVKFASPLDSRGSSSSPPQSSAPPAPRTSSREAAPAGIKSSLRWPAGPASSSSLVPGRSTEERTAPGRKSSTKAQDHDLSHGCSPEADSSPDEQPSVEVKEAESALEVIAHPDGRTEKVLAGGERLIIFPNGTRKEVSADGLTVKVTFFNGDTKQVTADRRVIYFYADAQTTHITYPDGLEVLHFPNSQTEKHFPDGRKEITFPDQTVKNLFPDGKEESVLTDGTIIQVNPDGTKEIHFNTGQREVHTTDYKRREYPDGTVKTVYTDGRQETHYPTGRLRVKDKDGNVIVDNRV
ncbi:centrosomal P4.1-associated protein [Aulostomus maculatus]